MHPLLSTRPDGRYQGMAYDLAKAFDVVRGHRLIKHDSSYIKFVEQAIRAITTAAVMADDRELSWRPVVHGLYLGFDGSSHSLYAPPGADGDVSITAPTRYVTVQELAALWLEHAVLPAGAMAPTEFEWVQDKLNDTVSVRAKETA